MLLSDIRDIFEETKAAVLASTFIAERLADLHDCPWAEWKGRGPMTNKQLSLKLREVYRVRSTTVESTKTAIRANARATGWTSAIRYAAKVVFVLRPTKIKYIRNHINKHPPPHHII